MGHRALVAHRSGPGYDLYYSHWGGADLSLARQLDGDPGRHPQVEPDPVATGVSRAALLAEHVDPLVHEALFVVDEGVAAYRPFWPGRLPGGGLLAAVDPTDPCGDAHLRGWLTGARGALTAAIEHRTVAAEAAGSAFDAALDDRFDATEVIRLAD